MAITLYFQRKQLEDGKQLGIWTYNAQVLRLIDEFLSAQMQMHRDKCSELWDNLKGGRSETVEGLRFAFERQIRDDACEAGEEWARFKSGEIYGQYASFIRLSRYFDMISFYTLDSQTSEALHFYYVWWRGFLIQVRDIFTGVWESVPPQERRLSFVPGWVGMPERLDRQFKTCGLPLE